MSRPSDLIECGVCGGRGSHRRRGRHSIECALCRGRGSISRDRIVALVELRDVVMRMADRMQAGDGDGAWREARAAARLARRMQ